METAFTRLVGCRVPVQLAPMPGVGTLDLVAAVSGSGGLGMVPAPLHTPESLGEELDALAARGRAPFGVNFLMPFLDRKAVGVAARRTRLVEFFYGEPEAALVEEVHAQGALAGWQVGSLREARAAERAGCDLLVAQGQEAGGHVRSTSGLFPLLARVIEEAGVPVLAAGGIATGAGLAAALAAGAAGARVGTRFVAAAESGAHPDYVQALLDASAEDTCRTEAFSGMWPEAPHRVLRSAVEAAYDASEDPVGRVTIGGERVPVARFSALAPTRETTGSIRAMALYAGESVGSVRRVEPAARIVAELVAEAEARLRAAAPAS